MRHGEGLCPFCSVRLRETSWPVLVGIVAVAAGCGPIVDSVDPSATEAVSDGSTSSSPSSSGSATPATSVTTSPGSLTSATTSDDSTSLDTGDDSTTSSASGGFIYGAPDGGPLLIECNVWDQDCPNGEKCMPWANDGGVSWNATRCSPVAVGAGQVGEPCTIEGGPASGIDDCELGSMCLGVDVEGTCVSLCSGSKNVPTCADPTTTCAIANEGVLALCLRTCDPLVQDCAGGDACWLNEGAFVCVPDVSGPLGVYADPCASDDARLPSDCDPGLVCVGQESVPMCADDACCTSFCDLTVADPNMQCEGYRFAQYCLPVFPKGFAPPGHEDVGLCMIPA